MHGEPGTVAATRDRRNPDLPRENVPVPGSLGHIDEDLDLLADEQRRPAGRVESVDHLQAPGYRPARWCRR